MSDFFSNKKVFITGGTGSLGRSLIKKLKTKFKDSRVIATGGLSKIFIDEINSIDFIYKDLTIFGLAKIYVSHFKI